MSRRDDKLVDEILHLDAAASWQARMTAVFFDAAAKRQLIKEIRDGVAASAADLEPTGLKELQRAVVARLVGIASRDAAAPAREASPQVEPLAGPELEDRVITTYPYPVATPYRTLTEQVSAAGGFGCLLDTFEGLIHYLATVAVSAYFRSGMANAECNRRLLERFLKDAWSTGDLLALLRETVRLAGDCEGSLPYSKLPAYLFTAQGKPTSSLQVLDAFVTLRNRVWGHGAGRDEAFFEGILPANRARLDQELARMPWLASWELIRPTIIDEAGVVSKVDLLMGERRLKGRPYELHLAASDWEPERGTVRAEKSLLLVAADRRRYLPLFPLSLFHFQLRSQGVYFLQRLQWRGAPEPRRLRKANYVAYESGLGEHAEAPGEPAIRLLEEHIQRLEARLSQAGVRTGELGPEPPPRDPDFELAEVRQEQEFHLRTFAGREPMLDALAEWIDSEAEGGYLLILGPPGQGKSALMAELARHESERGGCLLHMVKSHRNPLRFVPSLIGQAAKLAKVQFGAEAYRGDLDDLRNALVRALKVVLEKTGRAVLVLDALDELDASDQRIAFLPKSLPAGVRVVLTCRPDIPLLQALRARLPQLEERHLPPLSEADLPLVLERRLEAGVVRSLEGLVDWPALFQRFQGNPLFLQRALDQIAKAVTRARHDGLPIRLDLDALPTTLAALFQDIYAEIAERVGTRSTSLEGRQKGRLLQVLCLAREPLGFGQLQELLATEWILLSLEDCRDRVCEMSQYLLDTRGNRFTPWHQGLVDFVRTQLLGETGCRQVEEVFCTWLRGPAAKLSTYGLRHRVRHLLAARQFDEVCELLTDLSFLQAKAEAGMIFELAGDFTDAVQQVPVEHPRRRILLLLEEALRTDLHFLARHPTTLFQCLWNRCWWYDCPEAEEHYDPPRGGWPPEGPPWARPEPKVSTLLESWRVARESVTPRLPWLRSLRPPAIHLGTAQRAVFRGHEDSVLSVAFAPDGRRIVSGSFDDTVRVWDATSGTCLRAIQGKGDITAVAEAAARFPWRVLAKGLETVIESSSTWGEIAWFSAVMDLIRPHPSGRTWAGAVGNHISIFTLEGIE